jgi:hypothetical protein
MDVVGSLIAISLLLLVALGVAGMLLMGRPRRGPDADDADRRDR